MIEAARKMGIVHRSATRLPVRWPALWDLGVRGSWKQARLSDVSRFGAFVDFLDSSERPRFGDLVALVVEFDRETLVVEARVRWLKGQSGAGIAFLPEVGELAESLVWQLGEHGATRPEVSGVFRRPEF